MGMKVQRKGLAEAEIGLVPDVVGHARRQHYGFADIGRQSVGCVGKLLSSFVEETSRVTDEVKWRCWALFTCTVDVAQKGDSGGGTEA